MSGNIGTYIHVVKDIISLQKLYNVISISRLWGVHKHIHLVCCLCGAGGHHSHFMNEELAA